ncbi:hypothetical protein CHS0354_012757 [Potamilus streckersoni]|uniref:Uncharacterized protein n=1 Tax=Potamilus streckersoni TaxID=2493646 RepID=A0AAE0VJJ3_9BIVA|nr:hypothetical protein CHS0354_012757 [Potamilus streckersoni]
MRSKDIPFQFRLGPDIQVREYKYKPYNSYKPYNTYNEYKKVHLYERVRESNLKTKNGPEYPIREYKWTDKKPLYTGVYGDRWRKKQRDENKDLISKKEKAKKPIPAKVQRSRKVPKQPVPLPPIASQPSPSKQAPNIQQFPLDTFSRPTPKYGVVHVHDAIGTGNDPKNTYFPQAAGNRALLLSARSKSAFLEEIQSKVLYTPTSSHISPRYQMTLCTCRNCQLEKYLQSRNI